VKHPVYSADGNFGVWSKRTHGGMQKAGVLHFNASLVSQNNDVVRKGRGEMV
jgi:hypothetical protein